MLLSKPGSALKEGDRFEDEFGVFRVVEPDLLGCDDCDHKQYRCNNIRCYPGRNPNGGFRLLTEINYITHRLTK